MKVIAVIPARLASARLPRKMLREIGGQLLVARVYRAVRSSPLVDEVIVATDSPEIFEVCSQNGWRAQMTSAAHRSGTERKRVQEGFEHISGRGLPERAGRRATDPGRSTLQRCFELMRNPAATRVGTR